MDRVIIVSHDQNGTTLQTTVRYFISNTGNVQTIFCEVPGPPFPGWLRMRKFELTSLHQGKGVERLFTDNNMAHNMDTDLFMDEVYTSIMAAEKFRIVTA